MYGSLVTVKSFQAARCNIASSISDFPIIRVTSQGETFELLCNIEQQVEVDVLVNHILLTCEFQRVFFNNICF